MSSKNLLRLAKMARRAGRARQTGTCGPAGIFRSAAVKACSHRMRITPFRSSSRLRERRDPRQARRRVSAQPHARHASRVRHGRRSRL